MFENGVHCESRRRGRTSRKWERSASKRFIMISEYLSTNGNRRIQRTASTAERKSSTAPTREHNTKPKWAEDHGEKKSTQKRARMPPCNGPCRKDIDTKQSPAVQTIHASSGKASRSAKRTIVSSHLDRLFYQFEPFSFSFLAA